MKRNHIIFITSLVVLLAALAVALLLPPVNSWFNETERPATATTSEQFAVWEHGDTCIKLEVSDTRRQRQQGLSGRASLAPDRGMLFLYKLSGEYGFWMKDMNFPIDIIWLNKNNEVVTILPKVSPDTFPRIFYPTDSARKVLEVSAGVANELGIKQGDQLNVSPATTTPTVDCAML